MSDKTEKELKVLESELAELSGPLLEVSTEMISQGYTEFPIFIAHEGNIEDLGEVLFDAGEYQVPYHINVSMLEDFVESGIIPADKVELFKTAYGNAKQNMCVFFVTLAQARFVFYPYARRDSDNN